MATLFLTMLFSAGLLFFGYIFTVYILNEVRIFAVVPLATVIGFSAYVFLVNALSYAVPFRISVWLVFSSLLAIASRIYFLRRTQPMDLSLGEITYRQTKLLFLIAAVISVVSGIVAMRTIELDDMSLTHLSLASTIAQGNFPVMDPSAPDHKMGYHYAPDLLVAATNLFAGIPLWLGYDFQTFIFSGLTFLMSFLLAFYISQKYRSSLLAALFFVYGGGLLWLNFTEGISPLWHKFILHQDVFAPWKFLWRMTYPSFNPSFIYAMNNHSFAIGAPVMLLSLYTYFKALEDRNLRGIIFFIISALSFGYLALSLETNFAVLLGGFLSSIFGGMILFYLMGEERYIKLISAIDNKKEFFIVTGLVSAIGLAIAFYQGGILSTLGGSGGSGHTFTFAKEFGKIGFSGGYKAISSWEFFKEFGLPFVLFFPAIAYYRKDKKILFLALLSVIAFAVPFVIHYVSRPWEMNRFFGLATPLFAFISGLYLGNNFETDKFTPRVKFSLLLAALVVLSGIMFQLFSVLTPIGSIGKFNKPFLAIPPVPSRIDEAAYQWIKNNTTIQERFFPYSTDFIRDTGRFTPGYFINGSLSIHPEEIDLYDGIVKNCSLKAIEKLGIGYFYVTSSFPVQDWKLQCEEVDLNAVYSDHSNGDFVEIYKVKK